MSTLHLPDLQTLAALAIGLLAAVHVVRRWWPQWRRLWTTPGTAPPGGACSAAPRPSATGAACGSGCGQCGSATATAHKDHRIHVARRTSH